MFDCAGSRIWREVWRISSILALAADPPKARHWNDGLLLAMILKRVDGRRSCGKGWCQTAFGLLRDLIPCSCQVTPLQALQEQSGIRATEQLVLSSAKGAEAYLKSTLLPLMPTINLPLPFVRSRESEVRAEAPAPTSGGYCSTIARC
jgi:hypothetical protein